MKTSGEKTPASDQRRFASGCSRRQWIEIAAGAGMLTAFPAWAAENRAAPPQMDKPKVVGELSEDEKESAKSSRLVSHAMELRRAGGYNCAELILTAVVKSYGLPPKTSEAAAAFGAGVGHGELCGFLTGASMALGLLAFKSGEDRAESKKRLQKWNDALWTWWKGVAPLNCRDLRPQYDKAGFDRAMTRVCLQLEKIVAPISAA